MARPLKEDLQLDDGRFYVTVKVASQLCGVGVQTMRNYRDRPNPPPYNKDKDMYPVIELGEWIRTEQIYKQGVGGTYPFKPDMSRFGDGIGKTDPTVNMMPGLTAPEPVKKETQQERYERLRADKLEMEINAKAENFVLADEVLLAMSSMVSNVKTRLLAIPSQVASELAIKTDPVAVQEYLNEEMYIALESLTPDWTKEIEFGAEDDEDEDEDD